MKTFFIFILAMTLNASVFSQESGEAQEIESFLGEGIPVSDFGDSGDYYLDVATNRLFKKDYYGTWVQERDINPEQLEILESATSSVSADSFDLADLGEAPKKEECEGAEIHTVTDVDPQPQVDLGQEYRYTDLSQQKSIFEGLPRCSRTRDRVDARRARNGSRRTLSGGFRYELDQLPVNTRAGQPLCDPRTRQGTSFSPRTNRRFGSRRFMLRFRHGFSGKGISPF